MARAAAEILYLHPHGHLNDLVIPAGALSCLNGVAATRLGRYAFEVTDREIRDAAIVALDLHWSLAIPGLVLMLAHVRRVNPRAKIIVGGISAGLYAAELSRRRDLDYVIRGDAEVAFAALVRALLDGRQPTGIPNVFGRTLGPTPSRRMTRAEFDATDSLTVDWFPTYAQVTDWDAEAFGMGRTISVGRGCPMRCAPCYGSYASTFGAGYLLRSPASLARELRRAEDLGVRNLRLVIGKPPSRQLAELLAHLAASGPFTFDTTVGLYLCTPPARDDLRALEAAFAGPVAISVVPPAEHAPALGARRLADETARWRAAARHVARSSTLSLDMWATATDDLEALRRSLVTAKTTRVTVSLATVWHITRPTDDQGKPSMATVGEAMRPVWTFYAARLLSPALATLLAPFRFQDEIVEVPEHRPRPAEPLGWYFDLVMRSWRRHHVATLPGLGFFVWPVTLRRAAGRDPAVRQHAGTRYRGPVWIAPAGTFTLGRGRPVGLLERIDHSGVRLRSARPVGKTGDALALIPHPPPGVDVPLAAWARAMSQHGLVVVELPAAPRPLTLQVALRVQEAEIALLDAADEPVTRGRADLLYFRPPGDQRR